MKKLANLLPFGALFILLLLFYPGVSASSWRSNSDVHALIEFASSLLAITAGVMVLLHFFTTGRRFFLIISIGFVLIGTEEFVHALFSFDRIWLETPPTFKLAIPATWLAGNFVLAASFLLALSFGKGEVLPANRGRTAVADNIIGLICATSVTWLIFHSPRLPHFVELGSTSKQLIELSLALLFFGAFLFYSNAYLKQPYRSPLLWSIIACIIFRVLVHLFIFDARAFYDSHWDAAHLLVFLSYFFPIFGVWGETIKLHQSAQAQVIELGKAITERSRAEELLRVSQEHLLLATEGAKLGVWNWNTVTGELIWSDRCKALFGVRPDEAMSYQRFRDAIHPDDREKADRAVKDALDNHKDYDIEYRSLWPDGSIHWLEAKGRGYYDATGRAMCMEGVVLDIAGRKRQEAALRTALREAEALLKEVHHRVKNNLQVITSLLHLESRRSQQPATKAVLTDMQGRIRAMALLHETLYRSGNFAAVDLGAYLRDIATQSFRMLDRQPGLVGLTLDLAPVPIEMDQAVICGLLVNELISNCLKHGFPTGRGGEVRIALQPVAGGPQVCLRVSDTGVGLPVDFAAQRGQSLGLQLVADLSGQLNGTLAIGPEPQAVFALTFTPQAVKLPERSL